MDEDVNPQILNGISAVEANKAGLILRLFDPYDHRGYHTP